MYNFSWQKLQEKLFSICPNFFLARTLQVFKIAVGAVLSYRAFVIFVLILSSSASGGCQAWLKIAKFRQLAEEDGWACRGDVVGVTGVQVEPCSESLYQNKWLFTLRIPVPALITSCARKRMGDYLKLALLLPVSDSKMSAKPLNCRFLSFDLRSW